MCSSLTALLAGLKADATSVGRRVRGRRRLLSTPHQEMGIDRYLSILIRPGDEQVVRENIHAIYESPPSPGRPSHAPSRLRAPHRQPHETYAPASNHTGPHPAASTASRPRRRHPHHHRRHQPPLPPPPAHASAQSTTGSPAPATRAGSTVHSADSGRAATDGTTSVAAPASMARRTHVWSRSRALLSPPQTDARSGPQRELQCRARLGRHECAAAEGREGREGRWGFLRRSCVVVARGRGRGRGTGWRGGEGPRPELVCALLEGLADLAQVEDLGRRAGWSVEGGVDEAYDEACRQDCVAVKEEPS